VAGTLAGPVPGQGDVDRLLDQRPPVTVGLQLFLPGGQGLGDLAARGPDPPARLGARLGGQRADLGVGQGQRRMAARAASRMPVTSSGDSTATSTGSYCLLGADIGSCFPAA